MTRSTLETSSPSSIVGPASFKKAVGADLLPPGVPYRARFKLAADAGFEAIEMRDVADAEEAEEVREAASQTGLAIHSVGTFEHVRHPLSSGDRTEVDTCLAAVRTALDHAHLWGADTLLLTPAVVDAKTSYREAYARSHAVIRNELLPIAEKLQIVIGIENVWNGFLLSPLEYLRYIDDFESPWVRAYVDVGNVVFGHPEHWIRIVGSRIVKLHLKDFRLDRARGRFFFAKIGQGDIDWMAVRSALLDVGFAGYVTSTAMPRRRMIRALGRAARLSRRARAPSGIGRALAAIRWPADVVFVHDVARRFDRFRDGRHP